jgi:LysM repeat protein
MKKFLLIFGTAVFLGLPAPAQDPAVVERINRLSVYVEDLLADKARQQQQIADLTREVQSLREQLAAVRGGVSQQDLAALAESVREVDRKRQADREVILKEIEKLGRNLTAARPPPPASPPPERPSRPSYEYTVQQGDTLSAIVEAYRREGVRTSVEAVLKVNPGLNPTTMRIGQRIVIPQQ